MTTNLHEPYLAGAHPSTDKSSHAFTHSSPHRGNVLCLCVFLLVYLPGRPCHQGHMIWLAWWQTLHMDVIFYVCLSIRLYVCPSIRPSVCPSFRPFSCLETTLEHWLCWRICHNHFNILWLFICPSACLPACLPACLQSNLMRHAFETWCSLPLKGPKLWLWQLTYHNQSRNHETILAGAYPRPNKNSNSTPDSKAHIRPKSLSNATCDPCPNTNTYQSRNTGNALDIHMCQSGYHPGNGPAQE